MADLKVRLKFGDLEFECEGDPAVVKEERDWWLSKFVAGKPVPVAPAELKNPAKGKPDEKDGFQSPNAAPEAASLEATIFKRAKDSLTLSAKLPGENRIADAGLLLLWGYKEFCGNEETSAVRLVASLKESGYVFSRLDREVTEALRDGGFILSSGTKRSTRYRVTNSGSARGKALAQELNILM